MSQQPPFLPDETVSFPQQRWEISPPQPEKSQQLAISLDLHPLLAQVLINRGIDTPQKAEIFLQPELAILPSPLDAFTDLSVSLELLETAIKTGQKIAICGDYDADGMTSTALLMRSLSILGAIVNYAIPSRMHEGYGINERIVEDFHQEGIELILTVDNGIAAYQPIAKARELGLNVIITDHHDLPPKLPPANAILNPKLIPQSSPYYGLAGVGVAYVLAISLAQKLDNVNGLVNPLLELFTLGTIADLAPLIGVNRRWVKRGLKLLPQSQIPGVQALIQISGTGTVSPATTTAENPSNYPKYKQKSALKPEAIGFRLGPRINAVGRIADPQIVIELLTTDNMGIALERAMQCEQINQKRQQLCTEIEEQAILWCEQTEINFKQQRVLVIVQPGWHHGVIGIVASRLVERYGVPVFIGTEEENTENGEKMIRGSARSIPEFNVFDALQFSGDLLHKFGGHQAAGGFSLRADHLDKFRVRLSTFAHQCLEIQHLKPLVKIDVKTDLKNVNFDLFYQIDRLHPCGIKNDPPIFWTENACIIQQKIIGKGHIKLTLSQEKTEGKKLAVLPKIDAIAWRWGEYFPLPQRVDIAYKLRENTWNGRSAVELEIVGIRLPQPVQHQDPKLPKQATFYYSDRQYLCSLVNTNSGQELRIKNPQGEVLALQLGSSTGLLGKSRQEAKTVDLSHPYLQNLILTACQSLEINPT
ncbi:MAG: DHH family phosphoesterase [Microcoleaceae cyanobacterium]